MANVATSKHHNVAHMLALSLSLCVSPERTVLAAFFALDSKASNMIACIIASEAAGAQLQVDEEGLQEEGDVAARERPRRRAAWR